MGRQAGQALANPLRAGKLAMVWQAGGKPILFQLETSTVAGDWQGIVSNNNACAITRRAQPWC
jgi:hypothetical protein